MKTLSTDALINNCLQAARQSAPHLKRTPDNEYLLLLDGLREHLIPVFSRLHGLDKAEYAVNLWRYGFHRGMYRECLKMLLSSRAMSRHCPALMRLEACVAAGVLCHRLSNFKQSLFCLHAALDAARLLKSVRDEAFILLHLSQVYRITGNHVAAQEHINLCIAAACEINDDWVLACAYNELGILRLAERRLEEADCHFVECLNIWTRLGETRHGVEIIVNRACIAGELGKYDIAETYHRKSLDFCRILNDPRMLALCSHNLGDICAYNGKFKEARRLLVSSYEQSKKIGYTHMLPLTIRSMGIVCFKQDDYKQALRLFSLSEHLQVQTGSAPTALYRAEMDAALMVLRQRIKPNVLSLYWNQGRRMLANEAIALFNTQS